MKVDGVEVTFPYDSCTVNELHPNSYLVVCHNGKSEFTIFKTLEYSGIHYSLDTTKEDPPPVDTDVTFVTHGQNIFDISGSATLGNGKDSSFCIIDLKNMELIQ